MTQDTQMNHLIALYNGGQFEDVVAQAERLTLVDPSAFLIWNILAAAHRALGRLPEAEHAFRTAATLNPMYAEAHYNLGITLHDQGKFDAAVSAYHHVLSLNPQNAVVHFNMGNSLREQGDFDTAIAAYRRAVALHPAFPEAHNNLGNVLRRQGDIPAALLAYERAIESNPGYTEAIKNYAVALIDTGRMDEGIFAFRCVLDRQPTDLEAHMALGKALHDHKEMQQAILVYRNAIAIKPDFADAYNRLGVLLADTGDMAAAVAAYETACRINPDFAEAYNNLGNALNMQGKFNEAITAYTRSIALNPDNSDAYSNMGTALRNLGRSDEEFAAYRRAIEINPNSAVGYNNLASALSQIGKHDQAIAAYRRALEITPNDAGVEAQLLHQQQHICDFEQADLLEAASARLGVQTEATPPFLSLAWADRPDHQLARATLWAQTHFGKPAKVRPARPKGRTERLKVGLFSADIRPHPMMYCLSGLLQHYDRASLEIYAYSLHRGEAGDWPKTVAGQVDHFIQAEALSDAALIACALSHELDVVVDLTGYTAGNRCSVIQTRLAPVQINFLGYAGTMGAGFIDYIVADPIVIPKDQRPFYSEKVIYLPNSYFPIDYSQLAPAPPTTRANHGLPEGALVFCCFNTSYKIGPQEFASWMRILHGVKQGVLWLLKSNPWVEANLKAATVAANIDPDRLIFADKRPIAAHLERHHHADLFLDTFNCNAHTTACDALWAGVPVVTKIGRQFAARVAASLVDAVGLPELIASTEAEYEDIILRFAQDEAALRDLKQRLRNNSATGPLFDARRYARQFGDGLRAAYDRAAAGHMAEDVWVSDRPR